MDGRVIHCLAALDGKLFDWRPAWQGAAQLYPAWDGFTVNLQSREAASITKFARRSQQMRQRQTKASERKFMM